MVRIHLRPMTHQIEEDQMISSLAIALDLLRFYHRIETFFREIYLVIIFSKLSFGCVCMNGCTRISHSATPSFERKSGLLPVQRRLPCENFDGPWFVPWALLAPSWKARSPPHGVLDGSEGRSADLTLIIEL